MGASRLAARATGCCSIAEARLVARRARLARRIREQRRRLVQLERQTAEVRPRARGSANPRPSLFFHRALTDTGCPPSPHPARPRPRSRRLIPPPPGRGFLGCGSQRIRLRSSRARFALRLTSVFSPFRPWHFRVPPAAEATPTRPTPRAVSGGSGSRTCPSTASASAPSTSPSAAPQSCSSVPPLPLLLSAPKARRQNPPTNPPALRLPQTRGSDPFASRRRRRRRPRAAGGRDCRDGCLQPAGRARGQRCARRRRRRRRGRPLRDGRGPLPRGRQARACARRSLPPRGSCTDGVMLLRCCAWGNPLSSRQQTPARTAPCAAARPPSPPPRAAPFTPQEMARAAPAGARAGTPPPAAAAAPGAAAAGRRAAEGARSRGRHTGWGRRGKSRAGRRSERGGGGLVGVLLPAGSSRRRE